MNRNLLLRKRENAVRGEVMDQKPEDRNPPEDRMNVWTFLQAQQAAMQESMIAHGAYDKRQHQVRSLAFAGFLPRVLDCADIPEECLVFFEGISAHQTTESRLTAVYGSQGLEKISFALGCTAKIINLRSVGGHTTNSNGQTMLIERNGGGHWVHVSGNLSRDDENQIPPFMAVDIRASRRAVIMRDSQGCLWIYAGSDR